MLSQAAKICKKRYEATSGEKHEYRAVQRGSGDNIDAGQLTEHQHNETIFRPPKNFPIARGPIMTNHFVHMNLSH